MISGHKEKHFCNKSSHVCGLKCGFKDCENTCNLNVEHVETIHDCKNKHPCKVTCTVPECFKTCQFDQVVEHPEHNCGEVKCTFSCELCPKQCLFEDHGHQILIGRILIIFN